jgi:hypothetical protein
MPDGLGGLARVPVQVPIAHGIGRNKYWMGVQHAGQILAVDIAEAPLLGSNPKSKREARPSWGGRNSASREYRPHLGRRKPYGQRR